jgi:hypothetical protein
LDIERQQAAPFSLFLLWRTDPQSRIVLAKIFQLTYAFSSGNVSSGTKFFIAKLGHGFAEDSLVFYRELTTRYA